MLQIQQITDDSKQKQNLILPDGTSAALTISFIPQQNGWFILELSYLLFTLKNFRIFNSPNILHQYRNEIPFGLACVTKGDREPTQQQDFSSDNSKLFILTTAEVEEFTEYLSGQV